MYLEAQKNISLVMNEMMNVVHYMGYKPSSCKMDMAKAFSVKGDQLILYDIINRAYLFDGMKSHIIYPHSSPQVGHLETKV